MLKKTTHIETPDGETISEERLAVARTVYGEARGEGFKGMVAVANVIINRANVGGWFGTSPMLVSLKAYQFSVWNEGDPNRKLILSKFPNRGDAAFDSAWDIAGRALAGELADNTNGATHYHVKSMPEYPYWAPTLTETAVIGNHIFYS